MNLIVNGVMEKINRLIVQRSTCMIENQFAAEIKEWKASPRRGMQIKGSDYYEGRHEILNRQRTAIGRDGNLVPVKNLPNNKLIDNQYAKAVDQKVNYFVGKPFTVSCEDQTYSDLLAGYFNRGFFRQLKYLAEDALNNGLAWLYPYYGEDGHLAFKRFSGYEVLPFWADDDHTRLDCAARLYTQEVWNGYTKETVEKVELFRKDGIHRYIFQNDMLLPDTAAGEYETYFTGPGPDGPDTGYNWERIPLIPFKYNKQELPLIQRVKCLQDAINTLLSDFTNNMQEDARNTINNMTGSAISATGIICGIFAVAASLILNTGIGVYNSFLAIIGTFVNFFLGIIEWVLNAANGGFDSFGGAVANLIGQIISWFLSLGQVVTTIIDAIFGTNWTAGLEDLKGTVTQWGKNDTAITLDRGDYSGIQRIQYSDAWDAGYSFGQGVDSKVSGLFDGFSMDSMGAFDFGNTLERIEQNSGFTAANTAASSKKLDITSEELKYLRDIAEREAINRFTTAEVRIEQTNHNSISKDVDVDGIMDYWADWFAEKLDVSYEGVHG